MSELPPVRPEKPAEPLPAGMRPRVSALDLLRFLTELVGVGTLALWGFATWPFPWNIVVGIGAPLLAILVWALFVSPRAVVRVHPFIRAFVELLVFASASVAWWLMDAPWVGLAYGVVAVTVGVFAGRKSLS